MAQEIVCESSEETILVPVGDNVIGRGPLLKVVDKRVSRKHALLSLKDGQFALCPKHVNPCFYKASGQSSYVKLEKDKPQSLQYGDTFSLLPDGELSYRVSSKGAGLSAGKRTGEGKSPEAESRTSEETKSAKPEVDDILFGDISPGREDGKGSTNTGSPKPGAETQEKSVSAEDKKRSDGDKSDSLHSLSSSKDSENSSIPKLSHAISSSTGKKRVLPDWLSSSASIETTKPILNRAKEKASSVTKRGTNKKEASSVRDSLDKGLAGSPPAKKAKKDTSAEEVKTESKVKRAAPAAAPESKVKKAAPAAAPTTKAAKKDDGDVGGGDESKKKPPCPYGTKCYRKNPAHFREYSHDFAADSGNEEEEEEEEEDSLSSDKPVCQYGASCYRKNPAHLREYYHPPPGRAGRGTTLRSRPTRSKTKKEKKSLVEGDSDDDGLPNTYDYQDSFIDDVGAAESSTSYEDSEDSDWVAPTEDVGKGERMDDEEEDINKLLEEADDFISNKKMRR